MGLFRVIQNLSIVEKRYIRLMSGLQEGDKDYMRLFEILEKAEEYNEDRINMALRAEKIKKRLPGLKMYLYRFILKCLRNFYSGKSVTFRLKEMLMEVEIMYEKSLYEECGEILKEAKQTVQEHEAYTFIPEINKWEHRLRGVNEENISVEKTDEEMETSFRTIEKIKNIYQYWTLHRKMYLLMREAGDTKNPAVLEKINRLICDPLLEDEGRALSVTAKSYYNVTMGRYYQMKGDTALTYKHYYRNYLYTKQYPELIRENIYVYLSVLVSLAHAMFYLNRFDESMEILGVMRKLPDEFEHARNENVHARIFLYTYDYEMSLYIRKGEYEKTISLGPEVEKGIQRFGDAVIQDFMLSFYYYMTYSHFILGNYAHVLQWINKILNLRALENLRQDLNNSVRIIHLLVHYELRNFDVLEYLVRSAHRFFLKKGSLDSFEKLVLDYIRNKMPRITSPEEQLQSFADLKEKLTKLFSDKQEKNPLEYFDILSWLESKTENRPFAEIMRDKAKRLVPVLP